jgi:hypothetical protein
MKEYSTELLEQWDDWTPMLPSSSLAPGTIE